jgi:hypothetical protein
MRFGDFMDANIWIVIFWVATPFGFAGGYPCFGRTCFKHWQDGHEAGDRSSKSFGNHESTVT